MRYPSLTLLILLLFSCKSSTDKEEVQLVLPASTGKYLTSHTDFNIRVDESLQFRFSGTVIEENLVGTPVNTGIIRISPKVNGKAHWKDGSTLIFTPEKRLKYNTVYKVEIDLTQINSEAPKDLRNLTLNYKTLPLGLNLRLNRINYGSDDDGSNISISGNIRTQNIIENLELEDIIRLKQKENDNLKIEWSHHGNNRSNFIIHNIRRGKEASSIEVSWDASAVNSDETGKSIMEVLPEGDFTFIDAELDPDDPKVVNLSFSNRLDRSQDLTGLIRIQDFKGRISFERSGSKLKVYVDKDLPDNFVLYVSDKIKRMNGDHLKSSSEVTLETKDLEPGLKLIGQGIIVPDSEEAMFTFEAHNLKSATVEVMRIYHDNVLQYLQRGTLNQGTNIKEVGSLILREKIILDQYSTGKSNKAMTVALDIKKLMRTKPGALYQVRVGFDQSDVLKVSCDEDIDDLYVFDLEEYQSITDYRSGLGWENRNNPCHPDYYNPRRYIHRNILASDLGIIAKKGKDNSLLVSVRDLKTLAAISSVKVDIYDYQQQKIGATTTDAEGLTQIQLDREPSFLILEHLGQYGFVSTLDRRANSLSEYDISGKSKKKGIDGFIYGERGVWRPGDTLFLNFTLEDRDKVLPANHPVKFELTDSRSKKRYDQTTITNLGGIYHFPIPTQASDPTGNWRAVATVGNQKFTKTLKVETVKPNRLKIAYDLEEEELDFDKTKKIILSSKWLHGAPASKLKSKVDLRLTSKDTKFDRFLEYEFDDPARKIDAKSYKLFEGNLDETGSQAIELKQPKNWRPAGKVRAHLKTRVFEKSGNYSEDHYVLDASPYSNYVGIKIPSTRWGWNFIETSGGEKIRIATVDSAGKPTAGRNLKIGIYEARWDWWYDRGHSNRYNYNSGDHFGSILKDDVISDSSGEASYQVDLDGEGYYMIRVCDETSGHCTGGMFYLGENSYSRKTNNGPQLLHFTSDKKEYEAGENVKLNIPSNQESKIFVSIENGEKVLESFWVDGQHETTEVNINTTAAMNPNVYVHAALVQPHGLKSDLPLRMYGLLPIKVTDPSTKLTPILDAPQKVRPDDAIELTIKEKSGQEMYYSVAVVDEGLLDLTRFKTPDIWGHFNAKRALGVKTWDVYDQVLSGQVDAFDKLISIGGDAAYKNASTPAKANRFVPVVKHLGPFKLNPGQTAKHKINITNYVGAVKAMVVARKDLQYGGASTSILVKKPLMIKSTLPRVLGPGERLDVPVNVFAMEDNIKNVKLGLRAGPEVSLIGPAENNINFEKIGDKLSAFPLQVGEKVGITNFQFNATSGKETSQEEVEIEIRNPNPVTTRVQEKALRAGESWTTTYENFGSAGTNAGTLEISNLPPINLDKRLNYLIRYPYGCIEQTVSSAFPQLYLTDIVELSKKKQHQLEKNIQRGIERLTLFQSSSGGLSYWPGNSAVSEWGSNYAFHFLIEAKEKGFYVSNRFLDQLQKYLSKACKSYKPSKEKTRYNPNLTQAYRLYLLAKAGAPELGEMNRLRSWKQLSTSSTHFLAAAYGLAGKKDIAQELLNSRSVTIETYKETGHTYGSDLRDRGLLLESYMALGMLDEAASIVTRISKDLNRDRWYSTHSTAFALLTVGKFVSKFPKDGISFTWKHGNANASDFTTEKPMAVIDLDVETSTNSSITIKNTSNTLLYAKLLNSGQEPPGNTTEPSAQHLEMEVTYKDMDGKIIDPAILKQGIDFKSEVTIKNLGTNGRRIDEVALSQIFPSGWEIQNQRLANAPSDSSISNYEYQDIRDDRVITFFDIENTKKLKFTTLLTATYAGRFYMPPTYVEAMYDNEIQAKSSGKWVEVKK